MPYIRGQYHFPSTPSPGQIDARGAAFIHLQVSLWNVLAFHHDREREREAHWQQRAKDCAAELRRLLDPYEASAAIGEAGRQAKARFTSELASGKEWRKGRGVELKFEAQEGK